jgi:hypothetical protein
VRRLLIGFFLPFLLCTLPFLAAGLVLLCIPPKAREYFADHYGLMEVLIVGGGFSLFAVQMILCWRSLRWRGTGFDEGSDRWLSNLAQAAEWFPMLGLIGTVAGILEAFSSSQGGGGAIEPRVIAPAITATGSGLFMALINILPSWIVLLGRDLILLLSGTQPEAPGEAS